MAVRYTTVTNPESILILSMEDSEGAIARMRQEELLQRRHNLNKVLEKTEGNLAVFMDQIKENPSQEVSLSPWGTRTRPCRLARL